MQTKSILHLTATLFAALLFFSPTLPAQPSFKNKQYQTVDEVISAQEQAALSPDQVISNLKQGNQRFINNIHLVRDYPSQVKASENDQFPMAIVLSCIDSRVPVETVFDQGIGDLFVARVAGNVINTDILGSMEYACKVSGSKLIVVMGHESCGAVKATIGGYQMGNITSLLQKIEPAVEQSQGYSEDNSIKNKDYVNHVMEQNVQLALEDIRQQSPILNSMETDGLIKIVGAYYSLHSGEVIFFDE